ncbi:hypothetical protein V9T40_008176 [Parthenolecanium corni]|uniref:Uncharacterized protein n=1 Tax=Parthenolecanium corni TaxID=536013 RepID=A0AAN9TPP5_9HEMI
MACAVRQPVSVLPLRELPILFLDEYIVPSIFNHAVLPKQFLRSEQLVVERVEHVSDYRCYTYGEIGMRGKKDALVISFRSRASYCLREKEMAASPLTLEVPGGVIYDATRNFEVDCLVTPSCLVGLKQRVASYTGG